jgi:hypothetical protein
MMYCPHDDYDAELGAIQAAQTAVAKTATTTTTAAPTTNPWLKNAVSLAANLAARGVTPEKLATISPSLASTLKTAQAAATKAAATPTPSSLSSAATAIKTATSAVKAATTAAKAASTPTAQVAVAQAPTRVVQGGGVTQSVAVKTPTITPAAVSFKPVTTIAASTASIPVAKFPTATDEKLDTIGAVVERALAQAGSPIQSMLVEIKDAIDAHKKARIRAKGEAAAAHRRALEKFIRESLNTILSRLPPSNSTRAWISLLSK